MPCDCSSGDASRREFLLTAGAVMATAVGGLAADLPARVKQDGQRTWLDGVDHYRVLEPMFEAVRVTLAYRGERYTPAYLQGLSGAAFRIAGICPCAPTCSCAMAPEKLAELLGYEVKLMMLDEPQPGQIKALADAMRANRGALPSDEQLAKPELRELRRRLLAILAAIKDEIRAGRPAIVWNAFTKAEFDVVSGFDDAKGTFVGRGSYAGLGAEPASAPQTATLGAVYIGGPPGAILVGAKVRDFDAPAAELAALKEAVRHARSDLNQASVGTKKWAMLEGLRCYDRWIQDFRSPTKKRDLGDSYCWGILCSTHEAAAEFLREIAPRHGAVRADLEAAAQHFVAESAELKRGGPLLGWKAPAGPDARRNDQVVALLTTAREHYARGIVCLERALGLPTVGAGGRRRSLGLRSRRR